MGKVATEETSLNILNSLSNVISDSVGQRMADALELIAEGMKRNKIVIEMIDTEGNSISGENVIVKNLVTGMTMYNIPYNGTPIELEISKDVSYSITGTQDNIGVTGRYAPTTVEGIVQCDINITITYKIFDTSKGLLALQSVIRDNPGIEILPIGTEVTLDYKQEGQTTATPWKWAIMHYDYFVKEEDKETGKKTWGCILGAIEANDLNIVFDAPEQEEATETYALEGMTYYGLTGEQITASNITILDVAVGDDLTSYKEQYTKVFHNAIKDTSKNILQYGYNRWSHSAYRQWLNAEGNDWWTAQHIGDTSPSSSVYIGFLSGFSDEDKSALIPVAIKTALNTVTDSALGDSEITYDKMFLLSGENVAGNVNSGEGGAFEYFTKFLGIPVSNDANSLRIIKQFNGGSAQNCRLRSAYRTSSYSDWIVTSAGNVNYINVASIAFRCAPACVIL